MNRTDPVEAEGAKVRLADVALELLISEGADALSLRDLADRSEVPLSVVLAHYESREDLLEACKQRFFKNLGDEIAGVFTEAKGLGVDETIDFAIREMWRFARRHTAILRLLSLEAAGDPSEPLTAYEPRPFFAMTVAIFAKRLGVSPAVARVRFRALSVLIARFAVCGDAELASIFGRTGEAAAEQSLIEMARLLLGRGS